MENIANSEQLPSGYFCHDFSSENQAGNRISYAFKWTIAMKNDENKTSILLNELSKKINKLYGIVKIAGENFGEPAINSGPCGPFAHAFYNIWNQKFTEKVTIAFIMVKNSDECWHVLIRLPNLQLLEKHSGGLNRKYPRYCPNFSIGEVTDLIINCINLIEEI